MTSKTLEEYKKAVELAKGYPNPCENSFEYLAKEDPLKLIEWIKSGTLDNGHLTFAAEYLGRYTENSDFKTRFKVLSCLMKLLDHESAVVREGAVYGVRYHKVPLTVLKLEEMKLNDPSEGVKEAVRDVLHDWEFDEKKEGGQTADKK